jgi:hypothetical protein
LYRIPTPPPAPQVAAQQAPDAMDPHEKRRLRAAAYRAKQVYPGVVGKLIERELMTWEEMGWRLGGHTLVMQLVEHVMTAKLPAP